MQLLHTFVYIKNIDFGKTDRIKLCRHGAPGFEPVLSLYKLFININVTLVS